MAPEQELTIDFQGFAEGAEVLGATQANFLVDRPHHPAKELSVLLNDPAAAQLAVLLGQEDSPEFRRQATRQAGRLWTELRLKTGAPLESISFISKATLANHPELVEAMRALPGRLAPQKTSEEAGAAAAH